MRTSLIGAVMVSSLYLEASALPNKKPPPPARVGDSNLLPDTWWTEKPKTDIFNGFNNVSSTDIWVRKSSATRRLVCSVSIGQPPQDFNLEIDTLSSVTWVFGHKAYEKHGWMKKKLPKDRKRYMPKTSDLSGKLQQTNSKKTYKWRQAQWDGKGAKGEIYSDVVGVGKLFAFDQAFGAARVVNPRLVWDKGFEGVLGLGRIESSTISPTPKKGFFDRVAPSLARRVFTLAMGTERGYLNFGFINESLYSDKLLFTPQIDRFSMGFGHSFELASFGVGPLENATWTKKSILAVPDTASSAIIMPEEDADEYYKDFEVLDKVLLPGHLTGYIFPCWAKMPALSLQIPTEQNKELEEEQMEKPVLVRRKQNTGWTFDHVNMTAIFNDTAVVNGTPKEQENMIFSIHDMDLVYQKIRNNTCLGAIMASSPQAPPIWRLGWPFLKERFLAFDVEGKRMGFAKMIKLEKIKLGPPQPEDVDEEE